MAVPILLTGTLPEDFASVESKPNILDLMKELGFMTVWLSNQDDSVLRGSKINADLMLNRENIMLEPKFMFEKARFDGDLLPILDRILSYSKTKKFIVLHTSGSHMDYHIRYPEQFKKFSSLNDSMYTPEQQMNKQDAYDNSILYTDWVVSQVIERLNQQPGLVSVTYLSDHGEDMYDDVQQRAGHGTVDSSLYEQHIPFYFWGNAALRSHYQDKWNSLIRNRNRQFGGENYLHTWADFLDIDYPDQKKNLSIVQTNYMQRKNAKVLGGNANLLNIKIAD
jgi:glucan phosphoethanolaminetransferase (alkaline phosphatase superfamily)